MRPLQERGDTSWPESPSRPGADRLQRVLQLSDPHLLMQPRRLYRGRTPLAQLRQGLDAALTAIGGPPDLLLISGDLCQDESWGGYVQLRELLAGWDVPVALLPGNHDHPQLMHAVLARQAVVAPAELNLGGWRLLLLASHRPGEVGGWLGSRQRAWLQQRLRHDPRPTLVAVHHPPLPIGDPAFDAIGLGDGPELVEILAGASHVAAVLCGHVHQHWQGMVPGSHAPAEATVVLACPSTLCQFPAMQPCPLGRADDPGGRLLELGDDGRWRQTLLRWRPWPEPAAADSAT